MSSTRSILSLPAITLSARALILLWVAGTASLSTASEAGYCERPVLAVLNALACFQIEDPTCVETRYSADFSVLHNGKPNGMSSNDPAFWEIGFALFDVDMEINHVRRAGPDQVSIRYIETLSFIDGEAISQHEHALATVAPDCSITLWDQYGDNLEQLAVVRKYLELMGQDYGQF